MAVCWWLSSESFIRDGVSNSSATVFAGNLWNRAWRVVPRNISEGRNSFWTYTCRLVLSDFGKSFCIWKGGFPNCLLSYVSNRSQRRKNCLPSRILWLKRVWIASGIILVYGWPCCNKWFLLVSCIVLDLSCSSSSSSSFAFHTANYIPVHV